MQFLLNENSIFNRRIDRRSSSQKRLQAKIAEKRRERLQEEFSVDQLVELGFYDYQKKQRPFGVEIMSYTSEEMDADWYELRKIQKCKIRLFPPDGTSVTRIKKFNPHWNQESEGYYWVYQIYGAPMLWVCFDFLSRLIQLSCWDYCESVPLYWRFGNEKALDLLNRQMYLINQGRFNLNIPPPPIISPEDLEYQTRRSIQLRIPGDVYKLPATNKAKISYLRHHHTPYDYLWQTNKMTVEKAREVCNGLVEIKYPELFGGIDG